VIYGSTGEAHICKNERELQIFYGLEIFGRKYSENLQIFIINGCKL